MDDTAIRWAAKVPRDLIWRLYQRDASGIVDDELIDEVGLALYVRCVSIEHVRNGRLPCPRCGMLLAWPAKPHPLPSATLRCPTCGWETTYRAYVASWERQTLLGSDAEGAFPSFVERYPKATTPRDRMLLIDQLIHAFHQSFKKPFPHRSAANNLVEGSHQQALELLDRLAYGDASTPGLDETREAWQARAERMRLSWQGGEQARSLPPSERRAP